MAHFDAIGTLWGAFSKLNYVPRQDEIAQLGEIPVHTFERMPSSGFGQIVLKNLFDELHYSYREGEWLTLSDLLWMCATVKNKTTGGWNGFMQKVTEKIHHEKSFISFLPFVDLPAHDYNCINTVLQYAREKCQENSQNVTIVTFDLPLYMIAEDIVTNRSMEDVLVRLGGFHLLMSFPGCIGYIMAGSGLKESLALFYAPNSLK